MNVNKPCHIGFISNLNCYQKVSSILPNPAALKDTVSFTGKCKIIDADTSLLPGFKKREMKDFKDFSPEKCALVHMTNYFPKDGVIKSTKNATIDENGDSRCRATVHFAVNHCVNANMFGNAWASMPYGIILPMDKVFENVDNRNICGGQTVDFSILGDVPLPEGSVIVRRNENLPEGKLKIIEADEKDGISGSKGITIVETSEPDIHKAANLIIEKMGYSNLNKMYSQEFGISEEDYLLAIDNQEFAKLAETDDDKYSQIISKIMDNYEINQEAEESWKKFAKKYNFSSFMQMYLPWHRADVLLNTIWLLSITENSWEVNLDDDKEYGIPKLKAQEDENSIADVWNELYREECPDEIIDYKKEFLTVLDEIEKQLPPNKNINYDLNTMRRILTESVTPADALEKIKSELHIVPMPPQDENSKLPDKNETYTLIDTILAISDTQKEFLIYPQINEE